MMKKIAKSAAKEVATQLGLFRSLGMDPEAPIVVRLQKIGNYILKRWPEVQ